MARQSARGPAGAARQSASARDQAELLPHLSAAERRRWLRIAVLAAGGAAVAGHQHLETVAHGGKLDYFIDTVFNYPTLAECYKVAALDGINRLPRPWPTAQQ